MVVGLIWGEALSNNYCLKLVQDRTFIYLYGCNGREVTFLHCPLVAVRLVSDHTGPWRIGQRSGEPGLSRGRRERFEVSGLLCDDP